MILSNTREQRNFKVAYLGFILNAQEKFSKKHAFPKYSVCTAWPKSIAPTLDEPG